MLPADNFESSLLPKLNAVLQFALSSERSPFYREKYKRSLPGPLAAREDFLRLPFLERKDLLAVPWRERLFIAEGQVEVFGISSGTTDAGKPLIMPRWPDFIEAFLKHTAPPELLARLGVSKVMLLLPPFSGLQRQALIAPLPGVRVILGDVKNIGASALAAAELGMEGFITTPTGLERLIESYENAGFDLGAVKWASLGAEGMSKAKYAYLRSKLPRARFGIRFGAAEFAASRFFRCDYLEAEPDLFHPIPDSHLFEIVSSAGLPCELGEPGELVHTDLHVPKAFPFIRYRTGDGATSLPAVCPCGNKRLLRLTGKLGVEAFKYAGVTISAGLVESALSKLSDLVTPDFRLHLREVPRAGKLRPCLELHLIARRPMPEQREQENLAHRLARALSAELYLSGKSTFADLAEKGFFEPLTVRLVEAFPQEQGRPRKIITHF